MGAGFRLGKILGIPVRIDLSWFIIFFLILWWVSRSVLPAEVPGRPISHYLLVGLVTTLLFFLSVLLHEVAHSYVSTRMGLPVSSITLFIFGGVSSLTEEPKSARVEFEMAIVGPLTSLALAAVFFIIARLSAQEASYIWATASLLWQINLAVGIFNLIPGFPLDGGRVLRAIVWRITGNLRGATLVATTFGRGFGLLMIVTGIFFFFGGALINGIWLAFIGWFLLGAAQTSYQQVAARETFSRIAIAELPLTEVVGVGPDLSVQAFVDEYLLRRLENIFPVIAEGKLLGMVGIHEVQKLPRDRWPTTPLSQILRPVAEAETVSKEASAWEAVQRLARSECECVLVMKDEKPEGLLTRANLMQWMHTRQQLSQVG